MNYLPVEGSLLREALLLGNQPLNQAYKCFQSSFEVQRDLGLYGSFHKRIASAIDKVNSILKSQLSNTGAIKVMLASSRRQLLSSYGRCSLCKLELCLRCYSLHSREVDCTACDGFLLPICCLPDQIADPDFLLLH